MKILSKSILKFFYKAMLTGLPITTYNPYSNTPFHSPATICKYSTYVNFKLDYQQYKYVTNFLDKNTNNLQIHNINLEKYRDIDDKNYYLSINMYNCTSPLFNVVTEEKITRCEINTYVVNKNNEYGTLIMDYSSNYLSMDPDHIFKPANKCIFYKEKNNFFYHAENKYFKFDLDLKINENNDNLFFIDENLIKYTDKIFYNNGIYDKLYYDNTLVSAESKIPKIKKIYFEFFNLEFKNPESVFYFNNDLHFVAAIWNNLNE